MKAAVLYGPGDLQVMEKPRPELGPGEVLVKVEYCGICGSDLHAYKTGLFPFGLTIGHEYAGRVAGAGPGVAGWPEGRRVTGTASLACRECRPCREGRDNICAAMNVVGVTREGAMAEYLAVPARSLYGIPEGMPLEYGALVEPLSVALHGVDLSGVTEGDIAVILGAGTLGLCTLACLKMRGVGRILVIEVNEYRAEAALAMGAAAVLNPRMESVDNVLARLTGGAGADLVFECAGIPETIRESGNLARQGGTVVVLGICEAPVEMYFLGLVTREIQVRTSYGSTAEEFARSLQLLASGDADLAPLLSRVVPLEKVVEEGFAALQGEGCREVKILVQLT